MSKRTLSQIFDDETNEQIKWFKKKKMLNTLTINDEYKFNAYGLLILNDPNLIGELDESTDNYFLLCILALSKDCGAIQYITPSYKHFITLIKYGFTKNNNFNSYCHNYQDKITFIKNYLTYNYDLDNNLTHESDYYLDYNELMNKLENPNDVFYYETWSLCISLCTKCATQDKLINNLITKINEDEKVYFLLCILAINNHFELVNDFSIIKNFLPENKYYVFLVKYT